MNIEKLRLLQKTDNSKSVQVLSSIIDKLCGQNITLQRGVEWNIEEWWDMTEAWEHFCKDCAANQSSKQEILSRLDGMNQNLQQALVDTIVFRLEEIQNHLKTSAVHLSHCYLKDFDWQLKLVMSSDKMSNIKEPLVALNLDTVTGGRHKPVLVELDQDSLKKLITSLESANKAVTQLNS